jgi:hypothetical protein
MLREYKNSNPFFINFIYLNLIFIQIFVPIFIYFYQGFSIHRFDNLIHKVLFSKINLRALKNSINFTQ